MAAPMKTTRNFFEQSQLPASIRIELYLGRSRPRRDTTFDLLVSRRVEREAPTQDAVPDQAKHVFVSAD
jgi:hypothetical protein